MSKSGMWFCVQAIRRSSLQKGMMMPGPWRKGRRGPLFLPSHFLGVV